nr:MAG TPA: hypothetical protein [Caudoviricetes sp.]
MRDDYSDSLLLTAILVLVVTVFTALAPDWFIEAMEALL